MGSARPIQGVGGLGVAVIALSAAVLLIEVLSAATAWEAGSYYSALHPSGRGWAGWCRS